MIELLNIDCMQYMKDVPDKYFDLALCDPPYGIDFAKTHTGNGWVVKESKDWDKKILPPEYFKEMFRLSKNQIVCGGNYFTKHLPPSMGWVVWDKGQRDFSLADGELIWTSFNRALRIFNYSRAKLNQERGDHPTEKPVQLYKWLLKNYAKPEFKIIDTHGGSMSSVIAAYDFGIAEMVCCEIDKDYFEAGKKRFEIHKAQGKLFERYTYKLRK